MYVTDASKGALWKNRQQIPGLCADIKRRTDTRHGVDSGHPHRNCQNKKTGEFCLPQKRPGRMKTPGSGRWLFPILLQSLRKPVLEPFLPIAARKRPARRKLQNLWKPVSWASLMYQNGQQFYAGDGIVSQGVEATIENVGYLGGVGMKTTNDEIIRMMQQIV